MIGWTEPIVSTEQHLRQSINTAGAGVNVCEYRLQRMHYFLSTHPSAFYFSRSQASNRYKMQLEGLEDQLLQRLADAPADILADVSLIEVHEGHVYHESSS